jgi:hypothetical protein
MIWHERQKRCLSHSIVTIIVTRPQFDVALAPGANERVDNGVKMLACACNRSEDVLSSNVAPKEDHMRRMQPCT